MSEATDTPVNKSPMGPVMTRTRMTRTAMMPTVPIASRLRPSVLPRAFLARPPVWPEAHQQGETKFGRCQPRSQNADGGLEKVIEGVVLGAGFGAVIRLLRTWSCRQGSHASRLRWVLVQQGGRRQGAAGAQAAPRVCGDAAGVGARRR